jgi:hypothetical protein
MTPWQKLSRVLADDDVRSDETEDLLVALKRANVINGPTMVDLLGRYLPY